MIPYVKPSKNVKELDLKSIEILAYVDDQAVYELYDDDGKSYNLSYLTNIHIVKKAGDYDIKVDNDNPFIENINIKIIDSKNSIKHKEILIRGE